MKKYFSNKFFCSSILLIIIVSVVGIFIWQKYPFRVKQFKTISLGMQAAEGEGTHTVWAPPYNIVPKSNFYVYSLGDEGMCLAYDCGMGGYFVECLGGWLAGEIVRSEEFDYGLRDSGVDMSKQKIITIANKDAKIIGIYPGALIKNLPYLLQNHLDLFSDEDWTMCSNLLPSRWK